MAGRIRDHRAEEARVDDHHGSRYAGHTADHDDEQFAARHLCEIRAYEQRGFDHAHEYIGGSRQSDCSADAHGCFQDP